MLNVKLVGTAAIVVWCVTMLLGLSVFVGIVYAAVHFIGKFW